MATKMTREEALNKVRQMSLPKETMEILEALAPELAESEDERIRKRLIEYFEGFRIGNAKVKWEGLTVQDVLDWLEKQKENPKSADSIPSDCVSDVRCEDRWHKVGDSLPDNGRLVLAKDCLGNVLLARYDGENWEVDVYDNEDHYCHNSISKWCEIPSEKQKEQKSAEWDELQAEFRSINEAFEDGKKEVVDNPERYGLCKSAEWDEDEEFGKILNLVYKAIRKVLASFGVYSEDEELLDSREESIDYYSQRCAEEILKSLRPSWKPSEAQLPGIEDPGIPGKDFIPVDWVDACEKYGKWKIVKVK